MVEMIRFRDFILFSFPTEKEYHVRENRLSWIVCYKKDYVFTEHTVKLYLHYIDYRLSTRRKKRERKKVWN